MDSYLEIIGRKNKASLYLETVRTIWERKHKTDTEIEFCILLKKYYDSGIAIFKAHEFLYSADRYKKISDVPFESILSDKYSKESVIEYFYGSSDPINHLIDKIIDEYIASKTKTH